MSTRPFSELRDDLYERSPESRDRVEKQAEALTAELGLAELRQRVERTQSDIADSLGTTQPGVSRIERQDDVLVSTLREYVTATGGQLHLIAQYPDWQYEIALGPREPEDKEEQARRFKVVWQDSHTRRFVHVGQLTVEGPADYVFEYVLDAELHGDFEPFDDFPDLKQVYRSRVLFPFFAKRLPSTGRPGYDDHLAALGLTREEATPIELLARSWGIRPTDTIQIVPEPVRNEDGVEILTFLASGCRHIDESDPQRVAQQIAGLHRGQELFLREQPDNAWNPRALLIDVEHGKPVGWVPDYLLDYVNKRGSEAGSVKVCVEQANGPDVSWHLRLLCRMEST